MADYHVKINPDGRIMAGTIRKEGGWNRNSDVTEEALQAVRDHLLIVTMKEEKSMAYAWQYPNGKTLILKLEEKDSEELKDNKDENIS